MIGRGGGVNFAHTRIRIQPTKINADPCGSDPNQLSTTLIFSMNYYRKYRKFGVYSMKITGGQQKLFSTREKASR
jgi:hypothetical protein